jgi:hypothetical protein
MSQTWEHNSSPRFGDYPTYCRTQISAHLKAAIATRSVAVLRSHAERRNELPTQANLIDRRVP